MNQSNEKSAQVDTLLHLLAGNQPSQNLQSRRKALDQALERAIQREYCHFLRAEKSSQHFEALLRYQERLAYLADDCLSVVSFYDGIMSTITRFGDGSHFFGYVITRQTDGNHWQLMDVYVPKNSPLLQQTDSPQSSALSLKILKASRFNA